MGCLAVLNCSILARPLTWDGSATNPRARTVVLPGLNNETVDDWMRLHHRLVSEASAWHARQRSLGGRALALLGDSITERLRGTRLGFPYPSPPGDRVIPGVLAASELAVDWPDPLPLGIGGDQTQVRPSVPAVPSSNRHPSDRASLAAALALATGQQRDLWGDARRLPTRAQRADRSRSH